MYRKLLQLGGHSAVYGLASVVSKLVGLLLIPVYTRCLSPADYGLLAVCGTTLSILNTLSTAGIPSALFRCYLYVSTEPRTQRSVASTAILALVGLGLPIFFALVVFRSRIAHILLGSSTHAPLILLIALSNLGYLVQATRNTFYRMHNQSLQFAMVSLATFMAELSLSLWLVVKLDLGVLGALAASAATSLCFAVLFLPWLLRSMTAGFSRVILRQLLDYGLPMVPWALAIWALNFSDVYVLRHSRGDAAVGIYNLAYKFGLGIYLLTNALKFALPKFLFSESANEKAPRLFARLLTYYVVGFGFLALVPSVLNRELIRIAAPSFHAAHDLIPLVTLAYVLNGMIPILQVGIDISGKSKFLVVLFSLAAALNISLNLWLVPIYGARAAAANTCIAFGGLAFATYWVSVRLYPFTPEWKRLLKAAVALVGVFVASRLANRLGTGVSTVVNVLLLLLFVPALLAMRFVLDEEWAALGRLRHSFGGPGFLFRTPR